MVNRYRIEHNGQLDNLPSLIDLEDGMPIFGLRIGNSKGSIICYPVPEDSQECSTKRLRVYPITNFGISIPRISSFGQYSLLPSC
ncbi:MAG: hypothetical protein AABY07_06985 [Nanoarchaeota archaeon]